MSPASNSIAVVLVGGTPARAAEVATALERADNRFVVEPIAEIEAALETLRNSTVDCLLVVGTPDASIAAIVETARDPHPTLPIVACLDEPLDADTVAAAFDAGATDVVRECEDSDKISILVHRISNAVAAARAAADADRQRQRLDAFVRGVSHDLRNPLNVAQGRLELARDDCNSKHLADAAIAVDRTLELISDLLTLAKQGETPRDLEPIDLSALADECWANVDTGGATLVVKSDRRVLADANRLKRLLENLFRNAVDHGGDEVTVGDISPIYTTTRAEAVLPSGFFVEDDGPGIPPADRERVFEIGYTANEDGTGFGLNIVREVAVAHGWEVAVTEGTRGGARFEITGVESGN